jgi:8-amino-7-oxononanoate synthase
MKSTQSGLREDAREVLQNLVLRRRDAEQNGDKVRVPKQSPFSAMTDFATLPGMHELKLQRSMADVVGLANPFFKMHDSRSGATALIDGRSCINFSSYDYLGLNGHPEVQAAAVAAISTYGTSCSASRLVAGERPLHRELESALAAHYGQQAGIVFVSGHATNVATIGALLGPRDLVVYDSFAHNSIVLGAMLSGAERRAVAHNDLGALDELLGKHRARYQRVLIVVEGLYSMDGDYPDLPALVELKKRHGAWLMVDEAHGLGVLGETGKGLFELHGVDPREVDIWMGTLSKTLAGCGGYIAGQTALIEYLKCMSGGFVYSVGMPPPMAAASLAALGLLHREPRRVARLRANSKLFWELATARGLNVGTSLGHAVVPVIVHDSIIAVRLSQLLFDQGINVQPIIHPAVPERCARLRFFLTSEHTSEQIHATCDAIADTMKVIGDGRSILDSAR